MQELTGDIEEIRFRNEENGFSILVLDIGDEYITATGVFPPINEGESVRISGDYIIHPKFGRQFKVVKAEKRPPQTLDGIARFLSSGLIKGIGPKTAYIIVQKFGKETFDILENDPERLASIKGISIKKAMQIQHDYLINKNLQDAVIFMQSYGITTGRALKIYAEYGPDTVKIISANPYRLIEDISGIGFTTADKIAANMGIPKDGEFRIRAGIIYTMMDAGERNGNTYLPREMLVSEALKLLDIADETLIDEQIDKLVIERKLKCVEFDETGVMLTKTYHTERSVAVGLVKLIDSQNRLERDVDEDIDEFERLAGINFHSSQRDAIKLAVTNGVCVITGGPGTGKTTIIKCIIHIFDRIGITYMLMAPTGRAAKRMADSSGRESSTIHRALMLEGEGFSQSGAPLATGAVIVDEVSMMDIFLSDALISRLSPGTRLILVGDKDQLPSVGAGNVLKDILSMPIIPHIQLEMIFRQGKESLIVANAHAINSGKMPVLDDKNSDFFFLKATSHHDIAMTVTELVSERLPKFLKCDPERIQVLCPMKNGEAGVNNLNVLLQNKLNPLGMRPTLNGYREGDKVMHITNDYKLQWERTADGYERGEGVFNGDMGIVERIDPSDGTLTVLTDDARRIVYGASTIEELMLAYAVTVHKSQGSEFDAVVLPVTIGSPIIFTRNLLYTAITRAKKLVVIVGDTFSVKRMVDNDYIAKRYSGLKYFIEDAQRGMTLLFGE